MTRWLKNTSCPNCGSRDNRAIYDDGSEWCWGCQSYVPPTVQGRIISRISEVSDDYKAIYLPDDYNPLYIPKVAIDWISKYELTVKDIQKFHVGWSMLRNTLIFPWYSEDGYLFSWQERSMDQIVDGFKWRSFGKIHNTIMPLWRQRSAIVLVEDLLSAIKIHQMGQSSLPLAGSNLTTAQKSLLVKSCPTSTKIKFWLDRDKAKESVIMGRQMQQLGYNTEVIVTDLDPKEVSYLNMKELL